MFAVFKNITVDYTESMFAGIIRNPYSMENMERLEVFFSAVFIYTPLLSIALHLMQITRRLAYG